MHELPPAIFRDFVEQSSAMLDRLERDIVELRHTPGPGPVADRMAGALSAVRTGAGFLDLSELESTAWRGEELLASIRAEHARIDRDSLDALASAIDGLRGQLTDMNGAAGEAGASEAEMDAPSPILTPRFEPPSSPSSSSPPPAPQVPPAGKAETNVLRERALRAVAPEIAMHAKESPTENLATDAEIVAKAMDATTRANAAHIESCTAAASELAAGTGERQRLDAALDRLGDLVVHTNRLLATPLGVGEQQTPAPMITRVSGIADELARAAGSVRDAVLGARRRPLASLLRECASAVDDAAKRAGAAVHTECGGGEVEADVAVIERMRSPLAGICGAMAIAGGEAAGDALITIAAVADDSDESVEIRFESAFAAGEALLTSDGIDLARMAVQAIHGTFSTEDGPDGGTIVRVRVPNNLAFLDCMVVRMGDVLAAIPMVSIEEVLRPEPDQVSGSGASRVVLFTQGAASLLDGPSIFGTSDDCDAEALYVVVLANEGRRMAVSCTRAIGTQEVVVRPMDPLPTGGAPVRAIGASADGAPVYIVDVPALFGLGGKGSTHGGVAA